MILLRQKTYALGHMLELAGHQTNAGSLGAVGRAIETKTKNQVANIFAKRNVTPARRKAVEAAIQKRNRIAQELKSGHREMGLISETARLMHNPTISSRGGNFNEILKAQRAM